MCVACDLQNICRFLYCPPSALTSAPPIGVPTNAETLMAANMEPVRTPISRMSLIWATSAGARETKAPLENPKKAENNMSESEYQHTFLQKSLELPTWNIPSRRKPKRKHKNS